MVGAGSRCTEGAARRRPECRIWGHSLSPKTSSFLPVSPSQTHGLSALQSLSHSWKTVSKERCQRSKARPQVATLPPPISTGEMTHVQQDQLPWRVLLPFGSFSGLCHLVPEQVWKPPNADRPSLAADPASPALPHKPSDRLAGPRRRGRAEPRPSPASGRALHLPAQAAVGRARGSFLAH